MIEAIVTLITIDKVDGKEIPITRVHRLEFNTVKDLEDFEYSLWLQPTTNAEQLKGS